MRSTRWSRARRSPRPRPRPSAARSSVRKKAGWLTRAALAAALFSPGLSPAADAPRLSGELDAKGLSAAIGKQKGKVVLVNFWATCCSPCRQEFPDLVKLEKACRQRGLAVIGVSTDLAKDLPAVEKF